MLRAARTSVLLSLLIVVVYGSTNWFTAQRPDSDVSTWYFAWELAVIPYVPLMIVPYMSIDLFFFGATFLCRDEREMRVFSRRVVFSILVAAAVFLLLPLNLAWPERPRLGGWFGDFVEASCTAPFRATRYRNLPILDLTGPTQDQLHEAAAFIAEEAGKGTVYLHCKIGYSRSAAAAGAYLLASHEAPTAAEAVARLRKVRPSIIIRPEAMEALRTFARGEEEVGGLFRTNDSA